MTWRRSYFMLILGILLVITLHFTLDVNTGTAPSILPRRTLASSAFDAVRIELNRTNQPPVTIVRESRAEEWKMVSPVASDVDPSVVLRMTDALAFSPIASELSDAELLRLGRTSRDFELGDASFSITVGSGDKTTSVSFGTTTPVGDGVYAAVSGVSSVFVIPTNAFVCVNLVASDLRSRRMLPESAAEAVQIEIATAGKFIRMSRTSDAWSMTAPESGVVASDRMAKFLGLTDALSVVDFVRSAASGAKAEMPSATLLAGYGLEGDGKVVVSFAFANGRQSRITFGGKAGSDLVYAMCGSDGSVVTTGDAVCGFLAGGVSAFVDDRIFPVEAKTISAMSVKIGGNACLLARNEDGSWRMDAPVAAPADADAISELLGRVTSMKLADVATNGIAISIGSDRQAVVAERALSDFRIEQLRSREIVKMDLKKVRRLVIAEPERGQVSLLYDAERKAWSRENANAAMAVDTEKVNSLLAALSPLKALRVVKLKASVPELGAYGLDKPVRVVSVDGGDDESMRTNVMLGDVVDGGRYATAGSFDAVFVLPSETVEKLMAGVFK